MFSIKLKQLINVSPSIIIRNLRNSRQIKYNGPNPGLNKRIQAFEKQGIKLEDEDAEEFVETSDSNFFNAGEAYGEHLNETLIGKYDLQHKIVKEKYFKEIMPNLLTWSEKEQIRHLATTNPDEWTPERIAESFPVTAEIAKKLLKYPWKPASEQRIARHDASAMRNWRELKENTLNIPDNIRQHFLKFSERQIPPLSKKSIKDDLTQDDKIGEFEQIIKRCSKIDNAERNSENKSNNEHHKFTVHTNDKKVEKDPRRMTLDDLTAQIKERLDGGNEVNVPDQIIAETVKKNTMKIENNEVELMSYNSEDGKVMEYKEDDDKVNLFEYPERIRVPKNAYKRGATYKVRDCYYDHDGRFLYRVLGV